MGHKPVLTLQVEGKKGQEHKELRAHKWVLTTRYEYFKTLFASGMKESRTNRVVIADIDEETFENVLRFAYCCKPPDDMFYKATEYLSIAERYGMEDLKAVCCEALKTSLTPENFFETLAAAQTYHCEELKNGIYKFIEAGRLSQRKYIFGRTASF